MSIITKSAAVLACAAALLGLGTAAASASTTSTSARGQLGSTQGFHFYNMTGDPLTLAGITGNGQLDSKPAVGSVLPPGGVADFEIKYVSAWDTDTVRYKNSDGAQVIVQIAVEGGTIPESKCLASGPYECTRPFFHQKEITISEPQGTVHELNGVQAQAESEIVRQLCADGSAASCDFSPEGLPRPDYGPLHLVAQHTNTGDETVEWKLTSKDSVEETNSLDISIEAGSSFEALGEKIELKIKTTYGHEWTTKHGFDVSVNIPVKPGRTGYLYSQAPVLVYTGTLTVTIGNSTWKLHGVHFDTPDPSRPAVTSDSSGSAPITPVQPAHHG